MDFPIKFYIETKKYPSSGSASSSGIFKMLENKGFSMSLFPHPLDTRKSLRDRLKDVPVLHFFSEQASALFS